MLEKRNKRLLIVLVVLITTTLVVYWYGGSTDSDVVSKDLFRDYDLGSIDEIALSSARDTIALRFNGSRWRVNNEFPADHAMIDVLFATLQQVEPRRPVAISMQDSVTLRLRRQGVKVSLSAAGEVQKIFLAGGNETKNQAYFYDINSEKTYLMTIPGYRVYAAGIFELDEYGWRDKLVFGFNWRNFQRLAMTFPEKPSDDFVISMDNNAFSVLGMVSSDTTRVNDFLDNVSLLTVTDYIHSNRGMDSLSSRKPLATILVEDVGKNEYRLDLYAPLKTSKQYSGQINDTQWALFEESQIAELLRPRGFFGD